MQSNSILLKVMTAAMITVFYVSGNVWAETAAQLAETINVKAGPNLIASVIGNTVTVTGTLTAAPSNADFLTINIDAGVTVSWQATLQGTPSGNYSLINITGGSGAFWMTSGTIENTGTGRAITNNSSSEITISGGTVKAGNYYGTIYNASTGSLRVSNGVVSVTGDYNGTAIYNNSTGAIIISGGTVNATVGYNSTAIYNNSTGTVEIQSGNVNAASGTAIHSAYYSGAVTVSNGTVNATTGTAISSGNGILNISGGTVSATTGTAISTSGTVTISSNAKITSANTSSSGGTVYVNSLSDATLNINGGTVENTAIGTDGNAIYSNHNYGTINVCGGIVKATSGDAINYTSLSSPASKINISNGTVMTSGSGKAAVFSNLGTVKITGGTISVIQNNSYAVYCENRVSLTFGKSPNITGRIYTYPEKLELITVVPDIFVCGDKKYTLDFPTEQYAVSKIAVMNGRDFLGNFNLYNINYVLTIAGQHLAIATAYKVNFNLNGGTGIIPADVGVASGGNLFDKPSASDFTRTGYVNDDEWYTTSGCITKFVFGGSGTPITGNITLYLKWIKTHNFIDFDLNGGNGTKPADIAVAFEDDTIPIEKKPVTTGFTKTDYINDGKWYTRSDSSLNYVYTEFIFGKDGTVVNEDITLYLKWIPVYTVSFDLNDGYGTVPTNISVEHNSTIPELQKPLTDEFTKTGYVNDGKWYTNSAGTTEFIFGEDGMRITANTILYLKWESKDPISIGNVRKNYNKHGILLEKSIVSQSAKISVRMPEQAQINLVIYDNIGNVVFETTSRNGKEILWNLTNNAGRNVANGTYLIIVEARGNSGKTYKYSAKLGVRR
ncbi:MAG: InlB B-repeat-containing protein [Chitinispirillales bacterium]|jgi:hypothetical protein|nr:InlB B-repeat-containing protein [Chitinispirillales bacterium]